MKQELLNPIYNACIGDCDECIEMRLLKLDGFCSKQREKLVEARKIPIGRINPITGEPFPN